MYVDPITGLYVGTNLNPNFPTSNNSGMQPPENAFQDWDRAGAKPGSETETVALMKLIKELKPVAAINYHSNEHFIVYSDAFNTSPLHLETVRALVGDLASTQKDESNQLGNYRHGSVSEIFNGSQILGGMIEWMWENAGTFAIGIEHLSPELPTGWPVGVIRNAVVQNAKVTWRKFLDRIAGKSISGFVNLKNGPEN